MKYKKIYLKGRMWRQQRICRATRKGKRLGDHPICKSHKSVENRYRAKDITKGSQATQELSYGGLK